MFPQRNFLFFSPIYSPKKQKRRSAGCGTGRQTAPIFSPKNRKDSPGRYALSMIYSVLFHRLSRRQHIGYNAAFLKPLFKLCLIYFSRGYAYSFFSRTCREMARGVSMPSKRTTQAFLCSSTRITVPSPKTPWRTLQPSSYCACCVGLSSSRSLLL